MRKRKTLLLTALCVSILFCGCGKQDNNVDQQSEESAKIVELLESAEQAHSNGSKLDIYYEILALDPGNITARLGMAQCYIMQEEYEFASESLLLTAKLDPSNSEVYDMFEKLCKASGDRAYGDIALALAKQNNKNSFLELIPSEPVFSIESGEYTERVNIEVSSAESGADVYVSIVNDAENGYNIKESKYFTSMTLLRGTNIVSAYVVKNGIPSETVTMEYVINYEPVEVKFQEKAIEKIVRIVLNKPDGPITDVDCEGIRELSWGKLKSTVSSDEAYKKIQIKSLEDLKYFPRLTSFSAEYQNKIADFSPFEYCPLLTTLHLENCHLTTVDFVEFTPNLQRLGIYNYTTDWDVNINSIDALENFTELYYIDFRGNNLRDNSWRYLRIDNIIRNNPKIQYVHINSEQISDWNVLLGLDNLIHLNTWGIRGANFSVISKLKTLVSLYIWHGPSEYWNRVSMGSLSFLANLTDLTQLGLGGVDNVLDLKYIQGLEKLESLRLAEDSDVVENVEAMNALENALSNCSILKQ